MSTPMTPEREVQIRSFQLKCPEIAELCSVIDRLRANESLAAAAALERAEQAERSWLLAAEDSGNAAIIKAHQNAVRAITNLRSLHPDAQKLLHAHDTELLTKRDMEWWEQLALNDAVAPTPKAVKLWLLNLSKYEQDAAVQAALVEVEEYLRGAGLQITVRGFEKTTPDALEAVILGIRSLSSTNALERVKLEARLAERERLSVELENAAGALEAEGYQEMATFLRNRVYFWRTPQTPVVNECAQLAALDASKGCDHPEDHAPHACKDVPHTQRED